MVSLLVMMMAYLTEKMSDWRTVLLTALLMVN